MKEVKDMNLAEAIMALRDVDVITRGWQCNYDAIEELTDRIDTLLFEQAQRHDAWVDALENRINSLEAQHRWIPVSERMPTEEDGDGNGYVEFWNTRFKMSNYYKYDFSPFGVTHWKRITPPEGA
jgi:hypothetical protein